MSRRIYKFVLGLTTTQIIGMPKGAKALSVQVQAGEPALWVEVDEHAEVVGRIVVIHASGAQLKDTADADSFVGTIQLDDGGFVFHVFLLPESALSSPSSGEG